MSTYLPTSLHLPRHSLYYLFCFLPSVLMTLDDTLPQEKAIFYQLWCHLTITKFSVPPPFIEYPMMQGLWQLLIVNKKQAKVTGQARLISIMVVPQSTQRAW
jgi:hypothetical protein